MAKQRDILEFDGDLDGLWGMLGDLQPGECREVRHVTQGAQGVINRIAEDKRFDSFTTSKAKHRLPNMRRDARVFKICRQEEGQTHRANHGRAEENTW